MNRVKIVFPEYGNEVVKSALNLAKEKYGDGLEILTTESVEEACEKVRDNIADAMVAGIDHTSREIILSCRDIIGVKNPKITKIFSASFVLERNDEIYVLGDAAACKNPDEDMLFDIVLQTYETAKTVLNEPPRIAMLSFSTLGSGGDDKSISRIRNIVSRIHEAYPEIAIDGELQLDAAIDKEIGDKKAPGSTVAGRANVLIVPDLNSGNILYKAMERFGGFTAAGPILQGFKAPVSDLSRGSTVEDVLSAIDIEIKLVKAKNNA